MGHQPLDVELRQLIDSLLEVFALLLLLDLSQCIALPHTVGALVTVFIRHLFYIHVPVLIFARMNRVVTLRFVLFEQLLDDRILELVEILVGVAEAVAHLFVQFLTHLTKVGNGGILGYGRHLGRNVRYAVIHGVDIAVQLKSGQLFGVFAGGHSCEGLGAHGHEVVLDNGQQFAPGGIGFGLVTVAVWQPCEPEDDPFLVFGLIILGDESEVVFFGRQLLTFGSGIDVVGGFDTGSAIERDLLRGLLLVFRITFVCTLSLQS